VRRRLFRHAISGHFVANSQVCPPIIPCFASPKKALPFLLQHRLVYLSRTEQLICIIDFEELSIPFDPLFKGKPRGVKQILLPNLIGFLADLLGGFYCRRRLADSRAER